MTSYSQERFASWRKILIDDLSTFKNSTQIPIRWASKLVITVRKFKDRELTNLFTSHKRWKMFKKERIDDQCLEYVNSFLSTHVFNLFRILKQDFEDVRNPFGVLIMDFKVFILTDYYDFRSDYDAFTFLNEFCSMYIIFISTMVRSVSEYYDVINDLLYENTVQLRKVLLACVIKGETFTSLKESCRTYHDHTISQLKQIFSSQRGTSATNMNTQYAELKAQLERFYISENITEKAEVIQQMIDTIRLQQGEDK